MSLHLNTGLIMLQRPQKKLKKANEGQKGQIKGQTQVNIIFHTFFGINVFTIRF